ncbi:MAG: hypothetical protein JSV56_10725 [Methanomassiliicoccales archaeon]|nr:MAG: hypothetical protein JSV56_10725 [Methanomassiliicoccales archaeon]
MKRALSLAIILFIILQTVLLLPSACSDSNETEWEEHITIEGSFSTDNVRNHIQVNRTVVEIIIDLNWVSEEASPDLDLWIEGTDGNFVDTAYSTQIPEVMMVREFPNRGRWTVVITQKSCGSCGSGNYIMNITLRNIVLPELQLTSTEVNAKDEVNLKINSTYENISWYFFDFGDETETGWITRTSISKIYNTSGEYTPKAKVRYSDGTESDWVDKGLLEVKSEEEEPCLLMWVIIWTGLFSLIIFVISIWYDRKE